MTKLPAPKKQLFSCKMGAWPRSCDGYCNLEGPKQQDDNISCFRPSMPGSLIVVICDVDQFYIRHLIPSIFAKILYDHSPELNFDTLHVIQTLYMSDDHITEYSRTYAGEFRVVNDRSPSNQSIFYFLMTAVYIDFGVERLTSIDKFFEVIGSWTLWQNNICRSTLCNRKHIRHMFIHKDATFVTVPCSVLTPSFRCIVAL